MYVMPSRPGSVAGRSFRPRCRWRRCAKSSRLAARAPSGGNLQPWRVHALAGAVLEDLKARIRPHAPTNPRGEGAEYQVYPSPLKEPYNARRFEVGAALYRAIGIPREDRPARYRQYARNFEFFDAPVGPADFDRPQHGAAAMVRPRHVHPDRDAARPRLWARHLQHRGLDPSGTRRRRPSSPCRRRRWCSAAWRSAMATRRRRSTAGGRPARTSTALRISLDLSPKRRRSVDAVCG